MNWPKAHFSTVAEVVTGSTPSMKDPENYGAGVPWVKPPDLDGWDPVSSTAETLSQKGQGLARLLPPGAVMVCCIGATIGRVGIAGTTLATNQQINSLVFGPLIEPRFGYYYCRSIRPLFRRLASSAGIPILNKSNFAKIEIPVPPISEQRRIVHILDYIHDAARRRCESDQVISEILPVSFYRAFGDPATNSKGWRSVQLSEIVEETRNGLYKPAEFYGRGVSILKMFNIQDGELDLERIDLIDVTHEEYETYSLLPGDILLNRVNTPELVGKCAVITDGIGKAVFESKNIRIRLNTRAATPEYVASYLNSPSGRVALRGAVKHAIGMATLNNADLMNLALLLPPYHLQEKWSSVVKRMRALNTKRMNCQQELKVLYDNLLHAAFSGDLTREWKTKHSEMLRPEIDRVSNELGIVEEAWRC